MIEPVSCPHCGEIPRCKCDRERIDRLRRAARDLQTAVQYRNTYRLDDALMRTREALAEFEK